jgi:hypothetical protein
MSVGLGMSTGIAIGVAIGAAMNDLAIGIAIGVALGAGLGAAGRGSGDDEEFGPHTSRDWRPPVAVQRRGRRRRRPMVARWRARAVLRW